MNDHGVVTEAGTIRFERVLPGPVERVWAYLVNSEKRGKWLAPGAMQLSAGGMVELNFRHDDLSPKKEPVPEKYKDLAQGATLTGRVTRCDPPRLLSYTWGDDDSEVTFELTPRGSDVLLVLTHRRIPAGEGMIQTAGGWHTHLAILEDNLRNREPRPFWSAHMKVEGEYTKRLA
jgi:uncharacterized protein YndB with AHSA1/START domain